MGQGGEADQRVYIHSETRATRTDTFELAVGFDTADSQQRVRIDRASVGDSCCSNPVDVCVPRNGDQSPSASASQERSTARESLSVCHHCQQ
jgi:hypothetical protein